MRESSSLGYPREAQYSDGNAREEQGHMVCRNQVMPTYEVGLTAVPSEDRRCALILNVTIPWGYGHHKKLWLKPGWFGASVLKVALLCYLQD